MLRIISFERKILNTHSFMHTMQIAKIRLVRCLHTEVSYIPTKRDLALLRKDLKQFRNTPSHELAPPATEVINTIEQPFNPLVSRIQAHRTTKAADYMWALRQNLQKHETFDSIKESFNKLERTVLSINDMNQPLVSIDVKSVKNHLREVGVSILSGRPGFFPTIESHHLIIEEHHGVLSSNAFQGTSKVIPLFDSKQLLEELFHGLSPDYQLISSRRSINELNGSIGLELHKDVIDLRSLYALPFQYNKTLGLQPLLRFPKFLDLETILTRLNLPHTFLINSGNRAYYQLMALLSLTNPYHRKMFKLDNVLGNLEFMEVFLQAELDGLLKDSAVDTIAGYTQAQQARMLSFQRHEDGIKEAFRICIP